MKKILNKAVIQKTVGKNVKKIRLLKGYTQEYLAEKIDKTINFISLLERGGSGISVFTLVDLCNALEVEPNAILEGIFEISDTKNYDLINSSFNYFDENDKKIVNDLVIYITNSKK